MIGFPEFVIARSRRLRGNPAKASVVLDCFAALAMTELEQLATSEDGGLTDA
jgi:hypothetical protein